MPPVLHSCCHSNKTVSHTKNIPWAPRHAAVYLKMHVRYTEVNANQSHYVMPPDVSVWIFGDLQKTRNTALVCMATSAASRLLTMCPSLVTESVCHCLRGRAEITLMISVGTFLWSCRDLVGVTGDIIQPSGSYYL